MEIYWTMKIRATMCVDIANVDKVNLLFRLLLVANQQGEMEELLEKKGD